MRTNDARECMCVRDVCEEALEAASVKNRARNPNWAWLSLIYLAARRRDKRLDVEVAPLYRQLFSALKYPRPCPILRARINSTEEIGLLDNSCLLFVRERGFDRGKINFETSLDELYRERVPLFLYFSSHLRKLSQNSRETDEWTRLFAIPRDRGTRRGASIGNISTT